MKNTEIEYKQKEEWCCWMLSKEDIIDVAKSNDMNVEGLDFDEIADMTKRQIEWALDDVWEYIIRDSINMSKVKKQRYNNNYCCDVVK